MYDTRILLLIVGWTPLQVMTSFPLSKSERLTCRDEEKFATNISAELTLTSLRKAVNTKSTRSVTGPGSESLNKVVISVFSSLPLIDLLHSHLCAMRFVPM